MDTPVPVIDLGPFLSGAAAEPPAVARAIARACEDIGFFTIVGHGVDAGLVRAMYDVSRAFFDLPLDDKQRVRRPTPEQSRGYIGVGVRVAKTAALLTSTSRPPKARPRPAAPPVTIATLPSRRPSSRPFYHAGRGSAAWRPVTRRAWASSRAANGEASRPPGGAPADRRRLSPARTSCRKPAATW